MRSILFAVALSLIVGFALAPVAAEVCILTGSQLPVPLLDVWLERTFIVAIPVFVAATLLVWFGVAKFRSSVGAAMMAGSSFLLLGSFTAVVALLPSINLFYDRYSPVLPHATMWSQSYTESSFLAIRNGTDSKSVQALIGPPLAEIADGHVPF